MSNLVKSTVFGGIYTKEKKDKNSQNSDFEEIAPQLKNLSNVGKKSWKRSKKILVYIENSLKSHLSEKQEIYWPVLIAAILLLFVFASKIAFAEEFGAPNNLPIEDDSKMNLIGFEKAPDPVKISLASVQTSSKIDAAAQANSQGDNDSNNPDKDALRQHVAGIVKNTPMAAMVDQISEKDRTVAAFIVGIAMKESKFGVYAPHIGGHDCYNYWGLKAGGKTTAGGYSCFGSPDEAVSVVGKTIEKMVAKGVHTPAQAISWKCGASCAGQNSADVHKWIGDVSVNFNKINS